MKVYLNNELSNEQYHADTEHINGSGLWHIYDKCPAAWRYKDEEDEQSKALIFGTGSHTALLEPEKFDAQFARLPVVEDFPKDKDGKREIMVTARDMESWAKEKGIKGLSGKPKEEVIKLVLKASDGKAKILEVLRKEVADKNENKTLLEGGDYDAIMQMRAVIHANPYYANLLNGAYSEVSILGQLEGFNAKVRFDCLTKDEEIIDYKTAVTAKPDEFFRHAVRLGYFMKMAMQHDMFMEAYGRPPKAVSLLVQEKKSPYIPQLFELTQEQLNIGRIQLRGALTLYAACKKANSWPSYGMGSPRISMDTPDWYKKQFA